MIKELKLLAFLWIFLILNVADAYPQQTNFENELIIPPSPNATAISKYGAIPIGGATGIPSVNVPIYSWSNTNFPQGIDVSLNYFAGGLQVDQISSNIGMGWSLQAGGVISRVMRGIPDETESSGAMYHTGTANKLPVSEQEGNGPLNYAPNDWYFRKISANSLDGQFDLFNYSFLNHSGQFILGKNNDVLILDKSHLKVEKSFGTLYGVRRIIKFKITDEKGFIYEFNDYEVTKSNAVGIPPPHTSSWYLSKIIDATGVQTITFEYEDTFDAEINFSSNSYESFPVTTRYVGGNMSNGKFESRGGTSAQTVNGKRIKKILLPNGVDLNFSYSNSPREDLPTLSNNGLLQRVVVKTTMDSIGYLLKHDFSIGKNNVTGKGRATLKEVQKFGANGAKDGMPYKFEYYQPEFFPPLMSNRKDHWGFANSNPGILIPEEYVLASGGGSYAPYRKLTGGKRKTDPETVKYGSLSKISYPTGGFTIFEFESNTSNDPWLDKTVVTSISDPYKDISENFGVNSNSTPGGSFSFVFKGSGNSVNFTVKANPWFGTCPSSGGCGLLFELTNSNGGVMASSFLSYPSNTANTQTVSFGVNGLTLGQTYHFRVTVQGGITGYYDYVQVLRRELNPPGTVQEVIFGEVERFVGGLRLKKMQDFSSTGNLAQTKQFDYTMEDGITSSGSLGVRPRYTYFVKYGAIYEQSPYTGLNSTLETDDYIVRNSSSIFEFPLINGVPVIYKRIIETTISGNETMGKAIRHYTSYSDYPIQYQISPPFIPIDFAKDNYGNILKEFIYDSNAILVKETLNEYKILQDLYTSNTARKDNFRSIVISPAVFRHPNVFNPDPNNPTPVTDVWISTSQPVIYHRMSEYFPRYPSITKIIKSTTKLYNNGVLGSINISNYNYNEIYNNIKSVNSIASDGKVFNIDFKYTYDYPSDPVSIGMLQKNMSNVKLEEQSTIGTIKKLKKIWKYSLWENSYYKLSKEAILNGDSSDENKIQFLGYDKGLSREVKINSQPVTVYLWGYRSQFPIIEIKNTTYAEVVAVLTQPVIDNLNVATNSEATMETLIKNAADKLRSDSRLSKAMVTSYTYKPLVGMTSRTDARGVKETYKYDGMQRLQAILDQVGHVTKAIDYHYRSN